jgi:hypothetical protein
VLLVVAEHLHDEALHVDDPEVLMFGLGRPVISREVPDPVEQCGAAGQQAGPSLVHAYAGECARCCVRIRLPPHPTRA